jgi:hypothetical protein
MIKKTLLASAALLLPALVLAQPTECESLNLRVKTVSKNGPQITYVEFGSTGGMLDPAPVLQTQIQVFLRTCVVVHFSAMADPIDNHVVFQASLNNVPMSGHAQFPYLVGAPTVPVVWDPREHPTAGLSRMVSYTFTAPVSPGLHTIRIRFAGCCSASGVSQAIVRNAVMSIHY